MVKSLVIVGSSLAHLTLPWREASIVAVMSEARSPNPPVSKSINWNRFGLDRATQNMEAAVEGGGGLTKGH